jgi:hypothetical protein
VKNGVSLCVSGTKRQHTNTPVTQNNITKRNKSR